MIGPFDPAQWEKIAFTMQLNPGCEADYKTRHDEIFPDLVTLLKDAGIADYSIHLDPATHVLFGVLWRRKDHQMDALPLQPVMQRWWAHMADVMATNEKNEPLVTPLVEMFHLA